MNEVQYTPTDIFRDILLLCVICGSEILYFTYPPQHLKFPYARNYLRASQMQNKSGIAKLFKFCSYIRTNIIYHYFTLYDGRAVSI